jgi:DNA repair exonuclease SbcCD nuclease subunit
MPLLLHLSDVHLGARHEDLGPAAAQQRARQLGAFKRAIDVALERSVDVVLICGDLFDSNGQSKRSVERAVGELRRLTERSIRTVIIPGTHDCYDSRSIYRAFDLPAMAGVAGTDLLTVLTPERPDLVIGDLDLVIYGRVFATKRAPASPFAGLDANADRRASWKVGMIHGALRIPGKVETDDVMFEEQEIAASGLDYLALGHWHSFQQKTAGRTTWAYSGAPEPVAVDQDGAGSVCLVRLEPGVGGHVVRVDRITVGRTVFRTDTIDVASIPSQEDLVRQLSARADPDVVMVVELTGVTRDGFEIFPDEVERELSGAFLHLRIRDRSVNEIEPPPDLPRDTVAGRFVADMEERIRAVEASGDTTAAEHLREVSRLGRRLLLDDASRVTLV